MAASWRIELLGWLRVEQSGRWVTRFRTQKTGALLAYLAYYRQRSHPREELIELLWPEDDIDAARHKLRVALSSLRRQFEPPGSPNGSLIAASRAAVQLNPAVGTTDVAEFEAALQAAGRVGSSVERVQLLVEAVDLYRGELLPGFYEEWIEGERRRLAGAHRQALHRLIVDLEERRELPRALEYAHRAAATHPPQEEAHRDLIRLLAANQQPEAALRQYRTLEKLLRDEFDQDPAPATQELAREIEAQVYRPGTVPGGTPPPARARAPRSPLSSPTPLPTGTVTFLLIDIEGCGARGAMRTDPASAALERFCHRLGHELCRHGGQRVGEPEGPLLAAFARPSDALTAALAAQRALAGGQWLGEHQGSGEARARGEGAPAVGPPSRFRIALHTGEVPLEVGEYGSVALDDATRLLLATHPGQVLCSGGTAALLQGHREAVLPAFELADLGLYRLGSAGAAWSDRLFQVIDPEMPVQEFPPPKAQAVHRGPLPRSLNRFFGRETEIARLRELLWGDADDVGIALRWRSHRGHPGHGDTGTGSADSASPRLPVSPSRLVTLTGPAGVGKTALALALAEHLSGMFRGAIRFVPLADLADPPRITEAVRDSLGLPSVPSRDPLEQVMEAMSGQHTLLILDNFEHLASAGALVVRRLLTSVPSLVVLVTSRQCLGLSGEHEFPLQPLPVPEAARGEGQSAKGSEGHLGNLVPLAPCPLPEALLQCPSVQLFVDRARAVRPDFQVTKTNAADVAALCERLEGIPLALELAAARAQVLTPAQMLARLGQRLELLVRRPREASAAGAQGERHHSLRAAMEWSHRLLAPELQRFFAQLSIFRGTWTLEAAEAVCGEEGVQEGRPDRLNAQDRVPREARVDQQRAGYPPGARHERREGWMPPERPTPVLEYLEQLRDSSLLVVEEMGETMGFRMLETLREYAAEQLSDEERTVLAERHARFYLGLAEQAEAESGSAAQSIWLERLEREHANLRSALEWCREARQSELGLRLGGALWWFWYGRGYWSEGREQLAGLLARAEGAERTAARARALHGIGALAYLQGDGDAARVHLEESLAIWRKLDDPWGIAQSLGTLGLLAQRQGELESVRSLCEEALALCWRVENHWGIAFWLQILGDAALRRGDRGAAASLYREALTLLSELGDQRGIAESLHRLGRLALLQGEGEEARAFLEESLALQRELGDRRGIARSLYHTAELALRRGDWTEARARYEKSLAIRRELGDERGIAECLEGLAALAGVRGQREQSATLFGAAEILRDSTRLHLPPVEYSRAVRSRRIARTEFNESTFEVAWSQGRLLRLDQAIAYALEHRD